jgi:phage terminase large subunit-like protein
MYLLKSGDVYIADIVSARDTPGELDKLIYHTALVDGSDVEYAFWIDPAQAGIVDEEHTKKLFAGLVTIDGALPKALGNHLSFVREGQNKIHYAKPWSAYADPATSLGRFFLVRAPWNGRFLAEVERFPRPKGKEGESVKVDIVDAVSRGWIEIEKKKKGGKAHKFLSAMGRKRAVNLAVD